MVKQVMEALNVSDVALRKESVDRNLLNQQSQVQQTRSLSARRAWIEISMWCNAGKS